MLSAILVPGAVLPEVQLMGVCPVCDAVTFDTSAVCHRYVGHEEGSLAFSVFVLFGQQVSLDSCRQKCFHDAYVFFSGEQDALVYHLDLDPKLVDFLPE